MPKFGLIHPNNQIVGDGYIAWQWIVGNTVIESIYAARDGAVVNLDAGSYVTSMRLPEVEEKGSPLFVFEDEAAETLGAAILSAARWEQEWKRHAGTYLADALSRQPEEPEEVDAEIIDADTNTMEEVV